MNIDPSNLKYAGVDATQRYISAARLFLAGEIPFEVVAVKSWKNAQEAVRVVDARLFVPSSSDLRTKTLPFKRRTFSYVM